MSDEPVRIKRYPNRRFYDLDASKYISLEDIERLVCSGRHVEIRESQTGEDITRSVLTRIISERQPEKMLLFPTEMLHFILRANEVTTGFLRDYFRHSLTYLDYLSRHSSTTSTLVRPMHWAKAWLDAVAPRGDRVDSPPAPDAPDSETASQLALRVAELEKRLQQLEAQED